MSEPYYEDDQVTLWHGDALTVLRELPDASVDCCVTSPPYYALRDYGVTPTEWPEMSYAPMLGLPEFVVPAMSVPLGLEPDPFAYIGHLVLILREVRRVLADHGTTWWNIGDSYQSSGGKEGVGPNAVVGSTKRQEFGRTRPTSGLPEKNMLGIPWRTAFALQDDGWILRNDIIWAKPNAMPESVTDRLSTRHEHLFMLSKSRSYWFDLDPIREPHVSTPPGRAGKNALRGQKAMRPTGPNSGAYSEGGRNPGDVWTIATQPFSGAHFAVMSQALAERAILAGCKPGGTVFDPFSGSGTTGLAAAKHGRRYVGIDLNADYLDLSLRTRLGQTALLDGGVA